MKHSKTWDAFKTFVDEVLVCEDQAREIDAGQSGDGPVATALQYLGHSYEEANLMVWGPDHDFGGEK